MIKEYRVNIKGKTSGIYIIAKNPLEATKKVIRGSGHYSNLTAKDFTVKLWRTGKTLGTLKGKKPIHPFNLVKIKGREKKVWRRKKEEPFRYVKKKGKWIKVKIKSDWRTK